jgi:hypothetical protein
VWPPISELSTLHKPSNRRNPLKPLRKDFLQRLPVISPESLSLELYGINNGKQDQSKSSVARGEQQQQKINKKKIGMSRLLFAT